MQFQSQISPSLVFTRREAFKLALAMFLLVLSGNPPRLVPIPISFFSREPRWKARVR